MADFNEVINEIGKSEDRQSSRMETLGDLIRQKRNQSVIKEDPKSEQLTFDTIVVGDKQTEKQTPILRNQLSALNVLIDMFRNISTGIESFIKSQEDQFKYIKTQDQVKKDVVYKEGRRKEKKPPAIKKSKTPSKEEIGKTLGSNWLAMLLGAGGIAALIGSFMTEGPMKGIGKLFGKSALQIAFKMIGGALAKIGVGIAKKIKFVPYVGALVSMAFGVKRIIEGDVVGGLFEFASALANFIPVVGWAISTGIDVFLAMRDLRGGGTKKLKNSEGNKWLKNMFGIIGDWFKKVGAVIYDLPIIGDLIKAVQCFVKGDWKKGLWHLATTVPIFNAFMWIFEKVKPKVEKTKDFIKGGGLSNIWDKVVGFIIPKIKAFGDFIYNLPIIGDLIKSVQLFAKGDWKGGLKYLALSIPIVNVLYNLTQNLRSKETKTTENETDEKGILDFIGTLGSDVFKWIKDMIMAPVTAVKGFFTNIFEKDPEQKSQMEKLLSSIVSLGSTIFDGFIDIVDAIALRIKEPFDNIAKTIAEFEFKFPELPKIDPLGWVPWGKDKKKEQLKEGESVSIGDMPDKSKRKGGGFVGTKGPEMFVGGEAGRELVLSKTATDKFLMAAEKMEKMKNFEMMGEKTQVINTTNSKVINSGNTQTTIINNSPKLNYAM